MNTTQKCEDEGKIPEGLPRSLRYLGRVPYFPLHFVVHQCVPHPGPPPTYLLQLYVNASPMCQIVPLYPLCRILTCSA